MLPLEKKDKTKRWGQKKDRNKRGRKEDARFKSTEMFWVLVLLKPLLSSYLLSCTAVGLAVIGFRAWLDKMIQPSPAVRP